METQFMQRNGGRIAYDVRGEGPLVVCAPSLGDLRAEYRFLAPRLADAGYRVATMDLRGHGESSTGWPEHTHAAVGGDILALVRHLGGGPALLIGTSLSGGAAVWAAAEAPELVRGLVLIGPFVRSAMPVWQARLMFTPLFTGPWAIPAWMWYFRTLYATDRPADFDAYLDALRANLREPGRMAAVRAMITGSNSDTTRRLSRVQAPVLVVMGTKDRDFKDPAGEAQWIADQVRGEAHLIEGAGHYPHAEMPEQTAGAILAFAARVMLERPLVT